MEENKNKSYRDVMTEKLREELEELEKEEVDAGGIKLKPSQCYHFGQDPLHVLFNTNCPPGLKEKIQSIISRYIDYL